EPHLTVAGRPAVGQQEGLADAPLSTAVASGNAIRQGLGLPHHEVAVEGESAGTSPPSRPPDNAIFPTICGGPLDSPAAEKIFRAGRRLPRYTADSSCTRQGTRNACMRPSRAWNLVPCLTCLLGLASPCHAAKVDFNREVLPI